MARIARALATLLFVGLGSGSALGQELHAAGSTTVLPIVSQAAKAYHALHPSVQISVSGGGSGVGIASFAQGTVEIGMASREPEEVEIERLGKDVEIVTIAHDAVAVVVSKAVYEGGVHTLSLAQIAAIYRGQIENWKALGGPDSRILAIDKEASRGTRHVFAKAVLGSAHARAPGADLVAGSNNEEQTIVARSDQAIGMLSNAWLNDRVRGVAVGEPGHAILPTLEHVRDGRYPIRRALQVLISHHATAATRDFVRFILSPDGQKIVRESGYLAVQ